MKKFTFAIVIALIGLGSISALGSPFATEVVSGDGFLDGYGDTDVVLGAPTSSIYDKWSDANIDVSMVYGAWTADSIVSLMPGGQITVAFDSPVTNNPNNPYGADFIIFGNAAFNGMNGFWVEADTDMATYQINAEGTIFGGDQMVVSVRSNGEWYTFNQPLAGGYWPTQSYSEWDAASGTWNYSSPSDFTVPMNPNLMPEDFGGLTVTEALSLYNGSGGGTAFDIGALGLDEIDQIRVSGPGAIDAFAKVSPVPEPASMIILALGSLGIFIRRKF